MPGNERQAAADDLVLLAEAAEAAGALALSRWRDGPSGWEKADGSGLVTETDLEVDALLHERLTAARPRYGWLSEESADDPARLGASRTFVVDPIDGTRAFLCGAPTWGVLIALNAGGRPLVGVIDQPFTGERFAGVASGGDRRAVWTRAGASRPLRTRACPTLDRAILLSTFPEIGTAAERAGFEAVRDRARLTRYGLDCYGYALIALGMVDLVIEAGLGAYDVQALIPVIEGAGGVVTDWKGGDCSEGGRVLAAGDPRVHAEALALLRGVAE